MTSTTPTNTNKKPHQQPQHQYYPYTIISGNIINETTTTGSTSMMVSSNPQEDDHVVIPPLGSSSNTGSPSTAVDEYVEHDEDDNDEYESSQLLSLLPRSSSLSPSSRQNQQSAAGVFRTVPSSSSSSSSTTTVLWRIFSYFYLRCCQPFIRSVRYCCCCCTLSSPSSSLRRNTGSNSACTMQCVATAVLWGTITALLFAIVWYSYELFNHGTDPHLIAWFSAGAFVLLGFPVSMYGIISHLTNYNAPHIQVYIVRILWMVPIYSVESWLAMRFHKQAVFIETARDVYESFVLYCFLQFLIQVLGGEQALILMLKDKSPTRGVHMCYGLDKVLGLKPWLMGQPIRRSIYVPKSSTGTSSREFDANMGIKGARSTTTDATIVGDDEVTDDHHSDPNHLQPHRASVVERVTAALSPAPRPHPRFIQLVQQQQHLSPTNVAITTTTLPGIAPTTLSTIPSSSNSPYYRVYWTSPFFIQCKFGVLQYVLIKLFCAIAVLILEYYGWYNEGQFHFDAGYLYICILTNVSQCYALYCLIFFYFATKNELSPIRPVGKFLSVKALVFFTWWQSVLISVLYQMDMIPNYKASNTDKKWDSEDVAKGIQDYCICIEMFVAAIVHSFVFPHSEYSVAAVRAREHAMGGQGHDDQYPYNRTLDESGRVVYYNTKKRLGRRAGRQQQQHRFNVHHDLPSSPFHDKVNSSILAASNNRDPDLELVPMSIDDKQGIANNLDHHSHDTHSDDNSYGTWGSKESNHFNNQCCPIRPPPLYTLEDGVNDNLDNAMKNNNNVPSSIIAPTIKPNSTVDIIEGKPGLLRAFIDTAIPRDLRDNTVNMLLQRGEYTSSQKTTLLHHAATSDQYDLFAKNNHKRHQQHQNKQRSGSTRQKFNDIHTCTSDSQS